MDSPEGLTKERREIFDRIVGRKGDNVRLDPAIRTTERFFAERLTQAIQEAGFEAAFAFEDHRQSFATELFSDRQGGGICLILGAANGPAAYVMCSFPAAGIVADLMLGGEASFAADGADRPPTPLESDLIMQFAALIGGALQTTLGTPDQPAGIRIALSDEEIRDDAEPEPLVAFDIAFMFGDTRSTLTIAVTHHYLLQMSRPEPQRLRRPNTNKPSTANRSALGVAVKVSGSINVKTMTLGDIAALRPGNVIPLPAGAESNVRLKVKGLPLYECSIGRQGANYAMCLRRPHKVMNEALSGIKIPLDAAEHEDDDYE